MSVLRAENVSFGFGDHLILDELSLELRQGELAVLAGENASGKSTLLRLLCGLLAPNSGRIDVTGEYKPGPHHPVTMLFQNPDLQMIASTVEDEIALSLELRGVESTVIRREVDETLRRFSLQDIRYRSPEELSGGQKQRVAIAALMIQKQAFLLLDEPDSHLDAPARAALMQALEIIRPDCGILWTSPNPKRLPAADRFLLLSDRRIRELTRTELLQYIAPRVSA
jgi:energy-coupling factor transporter ATP-binding protein EcfA2